MNPREITLTLEDTDHDGPPFATIPKDEIRDFLRDVRGCTITGLKVEPGMFEDTLHLVFQVTD